jgi:hypothetical protein
VCRYDRLVEIAHEVLDDCEHCTGFEVENNNADGLAGSPSFFQDPEAPCVCLLCCFTLTLPATVSASASASAALSPPMLLLLLLLFVLLLMADANC